MKHLGHRVSRYIDECPVTQPADCDANVTVSPLQNIHDPSQYIRCLVSSVYGGCGLHFLVTIVFRFAKLYK